MTPIRATIEIESDGASPEGALSPPGGATLPFHGWAELAVVIEAWRASARREVHVRGRTTSRREESP